LERREHLKVATYYLVVGKRAISRAEKLCDCTSDQIERAKQEAIEALEKQLAQRNEEAIVRVVEESTRIVVFAVHKGNVDHLK
jgi:hypothetical protein